MARHSKRYLLRKDIIYNDRYVFSISINDAKWLIKIRREFQFKLH